MDLDGAPEYAGMEQTAVWGPPMWRMLHALAWNAEPADFVKFANLLQTLLPCMHCRASYVHYCQETPVTCFDVSKTETSKWTFFVHDRVNVKLSKPTTAYSTFIRRMQASPWCIADSEVWTVLFSCTFGALHHNADALGDAARLGGTLRAALSGSPLSSPAYLPDRILATENLLEQYLRCYNAFRVAHRMAALTRDQLDSQYLAKKEPPPPASRRVAPMGPRHGRPQSLRDPARYMHAVHRPSGRSQVLASTRYSASFQIKK